MKSSLVKKDTINRSVIELECTSYNPGKKPCYDDRKVLFLLTPRFSIEKKKISCLLSPGSGNKKTQSIKSIIRLQVQLHWFHDSQHNQMSIMFFFFCVTYNELIVLKFSCFFFLTIVYHKKFEKTRNTFHKLVVKMFVHLISSRFNKKKKPQTFSTFVKNKLLLAFL